MQEWMDAVAIVFSNGEKNREELNENSHAFVNN